MQDRGHLLRILGVGFGIAAVVGSVIGQGILRSPGVIAQATGSEALIVALWIGGALVSCLFAFAYAELGAAIPRAGGSYAFIHRALGGHASLLAAFAMLVTGYSTIAYLCFVVGEFLVRLGVGGGAIGPGTFGTVLMILFALLNASGTRISGMAQIVLSSAKGLVLLGLVIALFASPGSAPAPAEPTLREGWLPLGTAVVVVLTTYGGWWNLAFYGEEMADPGRDVPRSLIGGILGVGALYVVINIAMLQVMTPGQMAGSNLVAADAAGAVFGPRGAFFLTCFGVLSVGAIASLSVMSYTRLTYALARARILPAALSTVSRRGTPLRAMALAVVASGLLMLTGSYLALVSLGETVFLPVLLGVMLSVIVLRRREPDLPRPFHVPFYPWSIYLSMAVLAALLVVFIAQDPFYSVAGFVLVGAMWLAFQAVAILRGKRGFTGAEAEDIE